MSSRLLRFTQDDPRTLACNPRHNFALDSAITVYGKGVVFSFIPKNGCSTLRYSAALANQTIAGPEGVAWIHQNNTSFRPSHAELVTARYTFVVLRCPFHRLVSCFLDKIVSEPGILEELELLALRRRRRVPPAILRVVRRVRSRLAGAGLLSRDRLTFADFVSLLEVPGALDSDVHLRPQVDFLVYRSYDDVFRLEDLARLADRARTVADFDIRDARDLTNHGNHQRARIDSGFFGRTGIGALRGLKQAMQVPAYELFYDTELYDRVARLYREDVALFTGHFGQDAVMRRP